MLKQTHGEHSTITNNQMNDYSDPKYHNLYEEIVKDQQWTWGKFHPIPYPLINNEGELIDGHHRQQLRTIRRPSSQQHDET